MAITSAFQAEDAGSIPVGRLAPFKELFYLLKFYISLKKSVPLLGNSQKLCIFSSNRIP